MQRNRVPLGGQPAGLVLPVYLHTLAGDLEDEHALLGILALLLLVKLPVLFAQINYTHADAHIGAAIQRRDIVGRLALGFQAHSSLNSLSSAETARRTTCALISCSLVTLSALSINSGTRRS